MKRTLWGCALTALIASTAAQAQDDTEVFRPSSVWAADYGDDYCRLVRSFSNGKDEISIVLQRVQPGADTQLLLIGDALKSFRGADQLSWHFLPNDAERKSAYTRSETGNGQPYMRLDNVTLMPFTPPAPGTFPPPYQRTAEQTATKAFTGLVITGGLTKPVRIETGRLDAPVGALQTCADDLAASWGIDAEKHKTLTSPAIPQVGPDGWLPTGTIPFSQFAKFAGGGNQVRLMLDANGKATSCTIFSPTLDKSLNDKICQLLMDKATFVPAKDASGQAIASFWMGSPMFLGPPFPQRR